MRTTFFMLLFLAGLCAFCQHTISGTIYDKAGRQPIPFASIGISGKPIGTLSDQNGRFYLKLDENQMKDSIRISAISFKPLAFLASDLAGKEQENQVILMEALPVSLEEVTVRSGKLKFATLGTRRYSKNNCSGFASTDGNWKGSETAILIKNKRPAFVEAFSFYIIQNNYDDSVLFRLMFYSRELAQAKDDPTETEEYVGPTFLKRPVFFKVGLRKGLFTLDLGDYNIETNGDFFVSLECLVDEMDIARFCYSSSDRVPGYFKVKSYASWYKNPYGGADFNVKVSYRTE